MKLTSFSVSNYRSITTRQTIRLGNYSLLIGRNNDGKSNLLHALALGMRTLKWWSRLPRGQLLLNLPRLLPRRMMYIRDGVSGGHQDRYHWDMDFPMERQRTAADKGSTDISLEFEMTPREIQQYTKLPHSKANIQPLTCINMSFTKTDVSISIDKITRQTTKVSKQGHELAKFISNKIQFEYIPAIRTVDSAEYTISNLVEQNLSVLIKNESFSKAMAEVQKLQQVELNELGKSIQATISGFLPNVRSVHLESKHNTLINTLARNIDIVVDDGQPTSLIRKGDGVKSLVTLALVQHVSKQNASKQGAGKPESIIAIEEPESHLHSQAIHELSSVIADLSTTSQIILTSHSPLLVKPSDLTSTFIVKGKQIKANPSIDDVRKSLGVRFSDNLRHAKLVLLVEGKNDAAALEAIIPTRSKILKQALADREAIIVPLNSVNHLQEHVTNFRAGACLVQCLLDNDKEGHNATTRAQENGALRVTDYNLCSVPNLCESEIEDLYDRRLYKELFYSKFQVNITKLRKISKRKSTSKWSDAMEELFGHSGKRWGRHQKSKVKYWLSKFAQENPKRIISKALAGPIDAFIRGAEEKAQSR